MMRTPRFPLLLLFGSACFEEPEGFDGQSSNPGETGDTSGASTSTLGETVTSGSSDEASGSITASAEAASSRGSDEEGSSDSETGIELPCPACDTGFCTAAGTCAWAVFVSSTPFAGDLGGLAGADRRCNELARAAGLPGVYMAWLSSSSENAGSRIPGWSDPYVLVDGTQVAANFDVFRTYLDDLDAIYLEHAIDLTEAGERPERGTACASVQARIPVWTSSTPYEGAWDTYPTCNDWTSADVLAGDDEAGLGDARSIDSFWTAFGCSEIDCSRTASLYCMQVDP